VESIELESEGPSLSIVIVSFQDVGASHIGPLVNWFLDGLDVEERE